MFPCRDRFLQSLRIAFNLLHRIARLCLLQGALEKSKRVFVSLQFEIMLSQVRVNLGGEIHIQAGMRLKFFAAGLKERHTLGMMVHERMHDALSVENADRQQ